MHTTTLQKTLRPAISGIKRVARPWPMMVTLLGADLIGIATAVYLGVTLRLWFEGVFDPEFYWRLWPLLAVFTVIYAVFGLYPGVGLSPVDELRSVSVATTLSYLLLGSVIFFFKEDRFYSRGAFLMAWVFSIALVIIARTVMRRVCARHRWWGYPAVVFGAGKTGQMVVRTLQQHQHLGLKPVVILDDNRFQ
ncbi:MAG: undecaprenyl-phosphate galactose phosphotransferase WbaP, partial [Cyanobacteria bacterium P01_H01_bin.121]